MDAKQRVDLAAVEHVAERASLRSERDVDAGRTHVRREPEPAGQRAVEPADDPPVALRGEAELVGQDPLDPDARVLAVHAVLADRAADEVARPGDPGGGVHEHARVPEHPGREHREGDEVGAGGQGAQVVRQAELADVEPAVGDAGEDLRDGRAVQGRFEAVERDGPVEQRAGVVVAGDGDVHDGGPHVVRKPGANTSSQVSRRRDSPCSWW